MNLKLIIIPLALISTQIIAAPKIESLNHTIGTGIPKTSKIAADNSYDSISFSFNTGPIDIHPIAKARGFLPQDGHVRPQECSWLR